MELRVNLTHFPVTALGPGRRLGVWTQGCGLACPGCMSRDTWNPREGRAVPVRELAGLWETAAAEGAQGLTVSGGEPLDQPEAVTSLLAEARARGCADILVYTGYELEEAWRRAPDALRAADAVISGRYDVTAPTRLIWRGSANQVLTPLTEQGRNRYGPFIGFEPEQAPLQAGVDDGVLWLIGVPRSGDLARTESALRDLGIKLGGPSWRPR